MGFAIKVRGAVEGLAAVAATSALFYFGNGLEPIWPLVWIACIPLLWFALRSSWWGAACAAMASMLLGSLNLWNYLTKTLGMPGSMWLGIFAAAAVLFAAAILLFRVLVLGGALWSGLLSAPAVWVALEYSRNITTPNGTAGSLAYSQFQFLPFLQLASITGPWGMTFVLLMMQCAVAIWLHLRTAQNRRVNRVLGVTAGILLAILTFGAARLIMPEQRTVRVGLIASDLKENDSVLEPGHGTERLFRDYAKAAEELARHGARAVVIPEKLGVTVRGESKATDAIFQEFADRTGTTMVAGVVHVEGQLRYNEARIYVRNQSVRRYDKEHLLPPFESPLTQGTALTVLRQPQQLWGVAICKDMDFASPSRQYGERGVGLMLVPGWDFRVDGRWHGHIAIMRGVEDGFSVARAAKNGFLTVSDDRGRVLGEQASNSAPFAALLVNVPADHHWTLYQVLGDWFAWGAIALAAIAIGKSIWLRLVPRAARATAPESLGR